MSVWAQVVKIMVAHLKFFFHDGVRMAAAESLPFLLECARIRGPEYLAQMWQFIVPELLKAWRLSLLLSFFAFILFFYERITDLIFIGLF